MEEKRECYSLAIRSTHLADTNCDIHPLRHRSITAFVCAELATEFEVSGFAGSTDRFLEALPWLFLMSVIESRPQS